MRNALALVPKGAQQMVAATIRTVFYQADAESARSTWRRVADGFRPRWPRWQSSSMTQKTRCWRTWRFHLSTGARSGVRILKIKIDAEAVQRDHLQTVAARVEDFREVISAGLEHRSEEHTSELQ